MKTKRTFTAEQRVGRAAAMRRFRARNLERAREIAKRYAQTPRGVASSRRRAKKYFASKKAKANRKRWLTTPAGKRYWALHKLGLPTTVPAPVAMACQSLLQLRKEMRNVRNDRI